MTVPNQPIEAARAMLVQRYHILDTQPEAAYDDICQLAATICRTPVALISFIDQGRMWFKARIGEPQTETTAQLSICDDVIRMPDDLVVVHDIETDERFASKRASFRQDGMRFYAGTQLRTPEGISVGTVCVFDRLPREFSQENAAALAILARQVMALLELRRHVHLLQNTNTQLAEQSLAAPLTGIPSRVAFDKRLLIEGARAQRTKQNMALLLAEIGGIGAYGTTHGTVAADNALLTVARTITANARPYDYAARFDDTTFSLILPGAQYQDAAIVANRLKRSIAATAFPHAPLQLLTGFACVTTESDGPSLLLQAAIALEADRLAAERSSVAA